MRKLSLFLIIGLCGCAPSISKPTGEWSNHGVKDGSITATFPDAPKPNRESTRTPNGEVRLTNLAYQSPDGKAAISIGKVEYSDPEKFDADMALKTFLRDAADSAKGTVESDEAITMHGLPGKKGIVVTRKGVYLRMQAFVDKSAPATYFAQVAGSSQFVNGEQADFFFESVKIAP